ncbi:hypothetical protein IJH02_03445, partial [Candidatus Saccharibacteria bacterium]|nr:hypothetical protein [Candidatus Saccharibacteria bacterium]
RCPAHTGQGIVSLPVKITISPLRYAIPCVTLIMTFCVVRKSESGGLPEWFGLLALQAAAFASVSPVFHCPDIL